jgi:hypothetical protein
MLLLATLLALLGSCVGDPIRLEPRWEYQPYIDRNDPVEFRQAWQRQREADKQLETCLNALHL